MGRFSLVTHPSPATQMTGPPLSPSSPQETQTGPPAEHEKSAQEEPPGPHGPPASHVSCKAARDRQKEVRDSGG
jgi:hypothetical protein